MNTGYLIYQAERTRSAAEQREIDRSNAQLAVSIGRVWRALAAPVRLRGSRSAGLPRNTVRVRALGAGPIALGQQPARVWRRIAGGS
jgi:hypothetical protein